MSQLNLVVAGTRQAVLMVESEAAELSEEVMLGAVVFGHEQMQPVINLINELADEAGKPLWDWAPLDEGPGAGRQASLPSPRRACRKPTRSGRSNRARRSCRRLQAQVLKQLVRGRRRTGRRKSGAHHLQRPRSEDRTRPDPERRTPHRRPRYAHGAPDFDTHRRAAAGPWLRAVYARRDAGAGGGNARHRARRADHRCVAGRIHRALHAPLQHAAVCDRRDRTRGHVRSDARSAMADWPSVRS